MKFQSMLREMFKLSFMLMINFSLAFSPIPNLNINSYATEEACEDEQTSNPGVYKPGCKFNDALTKINEKPGSGAKGMIDQFVGLAFSAAALSSINFSPTVRSMVDCPMNHNAQVTLRMMQAGALAYILGEMKAKAEFKKASEKASKQAFAVKPKLKENSQANKLENNKQLAAFDTLIEVYEHKVKGIGVKKNLAMVSEVAYLGALGFELAKVMMFKGKCKVSKSALNLTDKKIEVQIKTDIASAQAGASNPTTSAQCSKAAASLLETQVTNTTNVVTKNTLSKKNKLLVIGKNVANIAMIAMGFSAVSKFFGGDKKFPITEIVALGGVFLAKKKLSNMKEKKEVTTESARVKTTIAAEGLSFAKSKSLCGSICPTCAKFLTTATMNTMNNSKPILCCGADAFGTPPAGLTALPNEMDKKTDIVIKKIPIIGENQKLLQLIKPAVLNTIEEAYFSNHLNQLGSSAPKIALRKMKNFYDYLNYLDHNFENEILNSSEFKKLDSEFKKMNGESSIFKESLANIKMNLVKDAHALDFKGILGFGVKLVVVTKFMGTFFRTKALITPRHRMYTFGVMAALNLVVSGFHGKKQKENERRLSAIKDERKKFLTASGIQTNVEEGSTAGSIAQGQIGTNNVSDFSSLSTKYEFACATPDKGGFTPAQCPVKLPEKGVGLDRLEAGDAQGVGPTLSGLPSMINSAVTSAASGLESTNPQAFSANIADVSGVRSAVRKRVGKLVDTYDKENSPLNLKTPEEIELNKLKSGIARIRSGMRGVLKGSDGIFNNGSGASTPKELSELDKKEDELDEKKNSVGSVASTPDFNIPTDSSHGNADFSFGEETESSIESLNTEEEYPEQDLAQFDLENSDISENEDANIFKMISNRYLRSYPVLLEEKE